MLTWQKSKDSKKVVPHFFVHFSIMVAIMWDFFFVFVFRRGTTISGSSKEGRGRKRKAQKGARKGEVGTKGGRAKEAEGRILFEK
jgi:hypothetical protein